jgi:hypothetical protein
MHAPAPSTTDSDTTLESPDSGGLVEDLVYS